MSRSRNVAAVAVSNAFRGLAIGGFQALFSMYMAKLGYPMSAIGVVVSVSSVVAAATLPAVGYLIDAYGPRKVVFGTGLMLAAALYLLTSPGLASLLASYALFLLAFFHGQPARLAFLARSVGRATLGASIGAVAAVFSASRVVGPVVGGCMAARFGYEGAFVVLGTAAAAGSAAFLALSSEVPSGGGGLDLRGLVTSYRSSVRPPAGLRTLCGIAGLDRFAWSLWFPMLSAHLSSWGYDEEQVGLLFGLQGLVQTLALPVLGRASDRVGPRRVVVLSEAAGVAAVLLLSDPSPGYRAYAGAAALGLSVATWVPGYNSLVVSLAPRGSLGQAYAATNMYRSLASVPAPYVGGVMYDALSPLAPFLASASTLVAASYAVLKLRACDAPRSRVSGLAPPQEGHP